MTTWEIILWPFALVLKAVWTALKWAVEILSVVIGALLYS